MEKQLFPCRENEIFTAVNALDDLVLEFHGSCPFQPYARCEIHAAISQRSLLPGSALYFYENRFHNLETTCTELLGQKAKAAQSSGPRSVQSGSLRACLLLLFSSQSYFHNASLARLQTNGQLGVTLYHLNDALLLKACADSDAGVL